MTLIRTEHWATRALDGFLRARARQPFAWGSNDCALFAADGVLAMTGVDIAAEFRGLYDSAAGAREAIRSVCGGEGLAAAAAWCAERHGLPEWPTPLYARRGDLVLINENGSLIAGLVHLTGRHVVTPGSEGLLRHPLRLAVRAWHVGPDTEMGASHV